LEHQNVEAGEAKCRAFLRSTAPSWPLLYQQPARRRDERLCRARVCENAPRAAADATLEARLEMIEKTLLTHDTALRDVYQKLKPLLLPPTETPKRRIGFHTEENND